MLRQIHSYLPLVLLPALLTGCSVTGSPKPPPPTIVHKVEPPTSQSSQTPATNTSLSRPEPRIEPLPTPATVTPIPLPSESLPPEVTPRDRPADLGLSSPARDAEPEIPSPSSPQVASPVNSPEPAQVVVDEPVIPETTPLPAETPEPVPIPEPKVFSMTAPPAVLALETDIEGDIKAGNLNDAAGSLERAIRIQPRNAELWHVLADVRLRQQQPGLAEDLAKKSSLMARNNPELVRKNWKIIAEARRLKGDYTGASEASVNAGD